MYSTFQDCHWRIPWLSAQWLWFSNCLQTSNSINRKCCIKTCEYFILMMKENWKIWKETLFRWYLGIRTRQIMPGGGDFVSFSSTRWPEFCTEKLSPGRGFWQKTLLARGSARGDSNRSNWYFHYFYPASPWDDSRSCRHPCCAKVSPPENLCVLLVNWDKPEISSSLHLLGSVRNVFWSGLTSQGKRASISFRFLSVALLHIHQLILLGKS